MNTTVRIFAWGNRGRRDDGVALVLAERVRGLTARQSDVAVHEFHQLGPEVADLLASCALAIFVDAHVYEDGPNERVERLLPADGGTLATHHCSPRELLRLTEVLRGHAPEAWLVAVRAFDLSFGEGLSEAAERSIETATAAIQGLVNTYSAAPAVRPFAHASARPSISAMDAPADTNGHAAAR